MQKRLKFSLFALALSSCITSTFATVSYECVGTPQNPPAGWTQGTKVAPASSSTWTVLGAYVTSNSTTLIFCSYTPLMMAGYYYTNARATNCYMQIGNKKDRIARGQGCDIKKEKSCQIICEST